MLLAARSYWGKTGEGDDYHPVFAHCLDVVACGYWLLERNPTLLQRLALASGVSAETLRGWLLFLLSLHDIGKLADPFQAKRPDLMEKLQGRVSGTHSTTRHDTHGWRFWHEVFWDSEAGQRLFAASDREDLADLVEPWINATMGHHGQPPQPESQSVRIDRIFPAPAAADAIAMAVTMAELLLPDGPPFGVEPYEEQLDRFATASWLFAGLAVAADWIGSNTTWFPLCPEASDTAAYWADRALPQAKIAVEKSGLVESQSSTVTGLDVLFGYSTPTPLQRFAEKTAVSEGEPQMVILEEVTGGGKTEAALLLAHRMMAAGNAAGIYWALPTMATANAMYERVAQVFEGLFAPAAEPSIILAHSRRKLVLGLEQTDRYRSPEGGEPSASDRCAAWLSDSRKKALLGQVGVGTIDQALLSILAARHQSLRLLGLAGKVLVVDEVHACDEYVRGLLRTLLRFHAALGGSAVLLSATLPLSQRQDLVDAYRLGLEQARPEEAENFRAVSTEFPVVTTVGGESVEEHPVAARPEASRRIRIERLEDLASVESYLAQTLEAGGCACWVRNTVQDAVDAFEAWRGRLGEDRVALFHSRFTVADRAEIERDVLRRFGPASGATERRGRLLIATQVVEQSLDLDFDGMVVDLCPIDLVLQRAGRLKRHRRDVAGNPIEGADERAPAVLGVFGPKATPSAGGTWYMDSFERAAYVYPHHGRLWLTARWLEAGSIELPEDSRGAIEAVYSEDAEARIPEGLREVSSKAEGRERADGSLARLNALSLESGYEPGAAWLEDTLTPTRLADDPSVTLCLLRGTADGVEPWHAELPFAFEQSQVQARVSQICKPDPELTPAELGELQARLPDEGKFTIPVVMTLEGGKWRGFAEGRHGRSCLEYAPGTGLMVGS